MCTQHVLQIFWAYNFHEQWTNCCRSYRGLVDAKTRASDKDLPVLAIIQDELETCMKWLSNFEFQAFKLDLIQKLATNEGVSVFLYF